jgi:DedD protein
VANITARLSLLLSAGCMLVSVLSAQNADSLTTVRTEEALARVRRYSASDVAAARVLADSLVTALPASSPLLAEALFAKAAIAASAAEAERDYGRIVTSQRFSPRVPDALMRLALLESARNNRVSALRHLDQLLRDHADSPARSRASLLAGRLRMEGNDLARACDLLAAAHASAGVTERDVQDQAQTLGERCPTPIADMAARDPVPMGIKRAPRPVATAKSSTPTPTPTAAPRRPRRDSVAAVVRAPQPVVPRDTVATPRPAPVVVRRDTVVARRDSVAAVPPVMARRDTVDAAPPVVAVPPRETATKPAPPAPVPPSAPRDSAVTPPRSSERFAVQFAAYNDRPGAEQFAATLRGRGIAARVEGTSAPFRVRAGRYTTRLEADAAAAVWRKPGQAAIVVSLGATP